MVAAAAVADVTHTLADRVYGAPHNISGAEATALRELWAATGSGAGWVRADAWGGPDPCTWFGVQCINAHVRTLLLPANGLAGSIPASFGGLAYVEQVDLRQNALIGTRRGGGARRRVEVHSC